jgi:hypothetical protein
MAAINKRSALVVLPSTYNVGIVAESAAGKIAVNTYRAGLLPISGTIPASISQFLWWWYCNSLSSPPLKEFRYFGCWHSQPETTGKFGGIKAISGERP